MITKVSKQKINTLIECIKLNKQPTAEQEEELFNIGNNTVSYQDKDIQKLIFKLDNTIRRTL